MDEQRVDESEKLTWSRGGDRDGVGEDCSLQVRQARGGLLPQTHLLPTAQPLHTTF